MLKTFAQYCSFSTRYSTALFSGCALALLLGMPSNALANTASSVSCQVVSPDGDYSPVANPGLSDGSTMSATNDTYPDGALTQCTWSGFFTSGTSASDTVVNFKSQVTFTDCSGSPIPHGKISVTNGGSTTYASWSTRSDFGPSDVMLTVPSGVSLSTLTIVGEVGAGPNDGCSVEMDLTALSITGP